ncbi:MAG: SMI1/KNR4 family protein [Chloroflexi bacterium]|nr:SMI1/KNR4 family protein [Chloroflexota bacterium]
MRSLDLDAVEVRGGPLLLATHDEVDALERDLGLTLPDGYREYITRLGDGTLNLLVRVLPPDRIRSGRTEHQGRMAAYWFWGDGRAGVDQQWAMGSIEIADTLDGDTLVVHPSSPGRIVVLPRDHERVFVRDHGLLEAIEWACSGRVLRHFGPKRYFEPVEPSELSERQHEAPRPTPTRTDPPTTAPDEPTPTDARAHLLAWFEAQREVEDWVVRETGGKGPFAGRRSHDRDERVFRTALQRLETVHARFCSGSMASAMGGGIETTSPSRHDPTQFVIRKERTSAGGVVVFQVAEGTTPGYGVSLVEYRLASTGAGWQVVSSRYRGWEADGEAPPADDAEDRPEDSPIPRPSLLSRLLRRGQ